MVRPASLLAAACVLALGCTGEIGTEGGGLQPGRGISAGPSSDRPGMAGAGAGERSRRAHEGETGTPGGDGVVPLGEAPDGTPYAPLQPAPAALRRLTQSQYANAIEDIFGSEISLASALEPDEETELFRSIGASRVATSAQGVEQYQQAALSLAQQVLSQRQRYPLLADCAPSRADDPCIGAFLRHYGRLLFRRPLTDEEVAGYSAVVAANGDDSAFLELGLRHALAALLQSPSFLYLVQVGEPDPDGGGLRYTAYEMASRLAFLLWDSTPDEPLLQAAEAGALLDDASLDAQVDRMLQTARGRSLPQRFFAEAWRTERLSDNGKDPERFPDWSPELVAAYRQEFRAVLDDLVLERDGDIRELFTARETFVDARLAGFYGIEGAQAPSGAEFERASLPAERVGLLTSGAVMAANAPSGRSSPTQRGVFVLEHILCEEVPPPPPDVDTAEIAQPDPDDFRTNRERLEEHRVNPACSGCHALFDPLGLGFENFDGIGRYRESVNGVMVDPSGELDGERFEGAHDIARFLHDDPRTSHCLSEQLYAFASGHEPALGERGAVEAIADRHVDGAHSFQTLLRALVESPGFRLMTVEE